MEKRNMTFNTQQELSASGVRLDAKDAVPLRRPGRWIGAAIVLVLLGMLVHLLVTNPNLQWEVVKTYLFSGIIMSGLLRTLELTATAMLLGLFIGIIIALMRLSANPVLNWVSWGYIWFFRGIPPIVQLLFWYNLASLTEKLSLGIPFFHVTFLSVTTNSAISPYTAALLGLALTESAYAAEMIRAGVQAVSRGQLEAASSLGMKRGQAMRRIVLPQALRIVIPPIFNDSISMLKFTSLVSVLAIPDLLYSAEEVYSRTYQTIPLLLVATIWYLVLSTILTVIEHRVEGRLRRGHASKDGRPGRPAMPGYRSRWRLWNGPSPSEEPAPIGLS
jgi:polar amino acid transport system permease protein